MAFTWLIPWLLIGAVAQADPSAPEVLKQKNSKCHVEKSGGEYPAYRIFNGRKELYAPSSDGIVNALFSPDGRYVALGAGEIDLIEGFGVMIVNCESGSRKGYRAGKPTFLRKWKKQALVVNGGEIRFSGKGSEALP